MHFPTLSEGHCILAFNEGIRSNTKPSETLHTSFSMKNRLLEAPVHSGKRSQAQLFKSPVFIALLGADLNILDTGKHRAQATLNASEENQRWV